MFIMKISPNILLLVSSIFLLCHTRFNTAWSKKTDINSNWNVFGGYPIIIVQEKGDARTKLFDNSVNIFQSLESVFPSLGSERSSLAVGANTVYNNIVSTSLEVRVIIIFAAQVNRLTIDTNKLKIRKEGCCCS